MKVVIYEGQKPDLETAKVNGHEENTVFIQSPVNSLDEWGETDEIILPSSLYQSDFKKYSKNLSIYFELEHQPAAVKLIEEVSTLHSPGKGVLRFRRAANNQAVALKAPGDLYVLAKLFGSIETIFSKHVYDETSNVGHTILSVTFTNKVIGHLEYSVFSVEKEIFEIEWSGQGMIVDYSTSRQALQVITSDENEPLLDGASIIEGSVPLDDQLKEELDSILEMLSASGKEDGPWSK